MKTILKAICLIVSAVCLCSACSKTGMEPSNPNGEPPASIAFYGLDELTRFISAPQADEEGYAHFMGEKGFELKSCGIRSREDLAAAVERFDRLPFPKSPEHSLNYMDFCPESGRFTIVFLLDGGHCYYTFFECGDEDPEAALARAIKGKDVSQITPDQPAPVKKLLALDDLSQYSSDPAVTKDMQIFYGVIGDYFVEFETYGVSRSAAEEAFRSFGYGTLSEVIGQGES